MSDGGAGGQGLMVEMPTIQPERCEDPREGWGSLYVLDQIPFSL